MDDKELQYYCYLHDVLTEQKKAGIRKDDTSYTAGADVEWITTESGSHIPLKNGKAVGGAGGKLNGKDFSKAKSQKTTKSSSTSGKTKTPAKTETSAKKTSSKPVDVDKYSFKNYRNPDGQRHPGYETYRGALKKMSEETEVQLGRALKNYAGETPPAKQVRIAFGNILNHSSVRDLIDPTSEQGMRDCYDAIRQRQNAIIKEAEAYSKWDSDKRQWVKP